jgi:hypothetical protein
MAEDDPFDLLDNFLSGENSIIIPTKEMPKLDLKKDQTTVTVKGLPVKTSKWVD